LPQFGVYRNPGRNAEIRYVVQIQSSRLDRSVGRVVVPLVRVGHRSPADHPLTPHLTVQGRLVYANPLDLATVPAKRLAEMLEILSEAAQDRIIRAIDEMITRA
jgi:toxin CcdB